MPLMIVESPTKIRTLRKILDSDWRFEATRGHMYDLPESEMGIDENYEARWVPQNGAPIGRLRKAASSIDRVYVASDPDREGEAIAWQVEDLVLERKHTHRIRLESITASEVKQRVDDPDQLDRRRVEAQWARRLLDRLAGYKISPFLIRAFEGKKLSAGRVQSAVLAKIVERWREVEEFEPETFYNLNVDLWPAGDEEALDEPLTASVVEWNGTNVGTGEGEILLQDQTVLEEWAERIEEGGLEILDRDREDTQTNPARPFDSSALIRTASSLFKWPASKTMRIAQSLYEKGLITYHRSDSTRVSRDGCRAAAAFIGEEYGKDHHQWRGGGGGDQEGHEAIRAQNPGLRPQDLNKIDGDYKRLYSLIWQRYVQSQMTAATWDTLTVRFSPPEVPELVLEGTMRAIRKWGFYRCRVPGVTPPPERERSRGELEGMARAGEVVVDSVSIHESETRGPRLYTEGSLIAMMKEEKIGRPSTYSSTIDRLRNRQYVENDGESLVPTSRGVDVCRFLKRAVPAVCDVDMTRKMERTLDEIARGNEEWKQFIRRFDERLEGWLSDASGLEPEGTAEGFREELDWAQCPRCDGGLILRKGSYGKFVHCESDDCDFSSDPPAKTYLCPKCERHMVRGKGGEPRVYYCLSHPECDGKRPVGHPRETYGEYMEDAPECPECGSRMTEREGRYGVFWGCTEYPDCKGTRSRSS